MVLKKACVLYPSLYVLNESRGYVWLVSWCCLLSCRLESKQASARADVYIDIASSCFEAVVVRSLQTDDYYLGSKLNGLLIPLYSYVVTGYI
jgi:hypothetical protein